MDKENNYFVCRTKDGHSFDFGRRCNNVNKWNGDCIIFKDKNIDEGTYAVLAIIPVDFIEIIKNVNAPEVM